MAKSTIRLAVLIAAWPTPLPLDTGWVPSASRGNSAGAGWRLVDAKWQIQPEPSDQQTQDATGASRCDLVLRDASFLEQVSISDFNSFGVALSSGRKIPWFQIVAIDKITVADTGLSISQIQELQAASSQPWFQIRNRLTRGDFRGVAAIIHTLRKNERLAPAQHHLLAQWMSVDASQRGDVNQAIVEYLQSLRYAETNWQATDDSADWLDIYRLPPREFPLDPTAPQWLDTAVNFPLAPCWSDAAQATEFLQETQSLTLDLREAKAETATQVLTVYRWMAAVASNDATQRDHARQMLVPLTASSGPLGGAFAQQLMELDNRLDGTPGANAVLEQAETTAGPDSYQFARPLRRLQLWAGGVHSLHSPDLEQQASGALRLMRLAFENQTAANLDTRARWPAINAAADEDAIRDQWAATALSQVAIWQLQRGNFSEHRALVDRIAQDYRQTTAAKRLGESAQ